MKNPFPTLLWNSEIVTTCDQYDRVLIVPSIRSLEFEIYLDFVINNLISYANQNRWVEAIYGDEVDLLEAGRIELFVRLRSKLYPWWAWLLAERSGHGKKFFIPCSDPPSPDVIELIRCGRKLGYHVILQPDPSFVVYSDNPKQTLPERIKNRIEIFKSEITERLPPIAIPDCNKAHRILYEDKYPNNINVLTPIYSALSKHEDVEQLYLAFSNGVKNSLKEKGIISYDIFRSYHNNNDRLEISNACDAIKSLINQWTDKVRPLIGTNAPPELAEIFISEVNDIVLRARRLSKRISWIFKEFRPTIVLVTTHASLDARLTCLHAKRDKSRSIYIQHGLYYDTPTLNHGVAEYACVWGKFFSDILKKWDEGYYKIVVTGSPKHDDICSKMSSFSKPHEKKQILFASTTPGKDLISYNDYAVGINELIHSANDHRDITFTIKLHPGESGKFIKEKCQTQSTNNNVKVTENSDIYQLIQNSDLVIAFSTVAFEALRFSRPVVLFDFSHSSKDTKLSALNGFENVKVIDKIGGLSEYLAFFYGSNIQYLTGNRNSDYLWESSGQALEKCLKLILD